MRLIWLIPLTLLASLPFSTAEVCSSPSGCEFWDDQYHEYILHDWDTTQIDVIIIPPASPWVLRDLETVEKGIDAWESGIQTYGASWLTSSFSIDYYTLGLDSIPQEVMLDPEIIVTSAEFNPVLLFGIGYNVPWVPCLDGALGMTPLHAHNGDAWSIWRGDCENLGNTCFVVNTNFLYGGERRMYDLNSHEFGHCLGVGHVGDALDFDAKTVPLTDIMSYAFDPYQVHCVSNLNVKGINGTFARTEGRPTSEWLDTGMYIHMDPDDYEQVACLNP